MRQPIRRGALAVIGALLGGMLLVPAVLAADASEKSGPHVAFQVLQDRAAFVSASHGAETITFDDLASGTLVGNPASFGLVTVTHSAAATFATNAGVFAPVSSPNVLAAFRTDGTLEFGDTSLTFAKNAHRVGFFLIVPSGSTADVIWTTSVTATDTKGQSLTVVVTLQGAVGEQQLVGFDSHHALESISFGPAVKVDGLAVLALDDLMLE